MDEKNGWMRKINGLKRYIKEEDEWKSKLDKEGR